MTRRWGEWRSELLVPGGYLITLRQAGTEGHVFKLRISAQGYLCLVFKSTGPEEVVVNIAVR